MDTYRPSIVDQAERQCQRVHHARFFSPESCVFSPDYHPFLRFSTENSQLETCAKYLTADDVLDIHCSPTFSEIMNVQWSEAYACALVMTFKPAQSQLPKKVSHMLIILCNPRCQW